MNCKRCGSEITENMKYCANCGASQCEEDIKRKRVFNLALITQLTVSALCIGLVILMFFNLASFEVKIINFNSQSNIVDLVEASVNGLSDYSYADYQKSINGINFQNLAKLKEVNFLNQFVVNEVDNRVFVEKFALYSTTLISIGMLILPIVLLGLTINDIVKNKTSERYKKFFFTTGILSLSLTVIIPLLTFNTGSSVIIYFILSQCGLLLPLVINLLTKKEKINIRLYMIRFLSILLPLILFLVSSIAIFIFSTKAFLFNISENNSYQNFAPLFNHLINWRVEETIGMNSSFINSLLPISDGFRSLKYIAMVIPIFMLVSVIYVFITLIFESAKVLKFRTKETRSDKYLVISSVFAVLSLALTILVSIGYNEYLNNSNSNEGISLTIGAGIIIYPLLLIISAIFYKIREKKYCAYLLLS